MNYNFSTIKTFYCTVLIILIQFNLAQACSCIGITSFCETIFYSPNIALVEVINKSPDNDSSFDVEVKQVISGIINEQKLSVNFYLTSCTDFISVKIGDELIVNFNLTYEIEEAPFPAIDFSGCAVNYLTLKNNIISGRIFGSESIELPEDDFYEKLNECADLSFVDSNNTFIKNLFRIVENPVLSELKVEMPTFLDETFDISIYNNQGKLIKLVKNTVGGLETIDVNTFSSGLYFCTFKIRNLMFTKKFIKI
jgi:hypothetical protein